MFKPGGRLSIWSGFNSSKYDVKVQYVDDEEGTIRD